ncbi:MAG TPA: hypothetical protein P5050_06070 [Bacteroidia bacterium]|nr:hypothetical protein [Sphingobacteriales bacterium]HPD65373.1 hypothetical protein [Bacteroidia bacterium]HRS58771.1 hypothetical protein [Bacteroidia bacterium]HRU69027.1 hypothetical protein [Bacteroidia bacterium]
MIDYQKAREKFAQLKDSDFAKVVDETEKQFPLKFSQLMTHVENQNHWEISYYAVHIRESYAFIFHDTELNTLCHKIEEAANVRDFDRVNEVAEMLKACSVKFLQQLAEIKKQLHAENE